MVMDRYFISFIRKKTSLDKNMKIVILNEIIQLIT